MRIAFLGLGKMGQLMAGHLLDAGHELTVWNRSSGKAGDLTGRGATEAATPREAAQGAEVVVTMLFDGDAVRGVLVDGPDAAVEGAAAGTLFVDSSTTGPDVARDLDAALAARGMRFVDAPVAGSTPVAGKGELGIFLGGSDDDVATAREVVSAWGAQDKIRHAGAVGTGQALKVVVNLSLGITITGIGECLRLARDLGIDTGLALDGLAGGPFGIMLGQKRELLEQQSYEPATFAVDAITKDLRLSLASTQGELAAARAALQAAENVVGSYGDADMAAIAGHIAFEGEPDSY